MRTVGSKWVAFATSLFVAGTAYASSDTDKELAEMRALVKELGQKVDAQQEQLQHQGGLLQDAQKVVREQLKELKGGGVELRIKVSSLPEVERWVLAWGGKARGRSGRIGRKCFARCRRSHSPQP